MGDFSFKSKLEKKALRNISTHLYNDFENTSITKSYSKTIYMREANI